MVDYSWALEHYYGSRTFVGVQYSIYFSQIQLVFMTLVCVHSFPLVG
jgi:hypothetical protein